MNEKVGIKNQEAQKDNSLSQKQNTDFSQPGNERFDHTLYLQRNLGNQAIQRMVESGASQDRVSRPTLRVSRQTVTPAISSRNGPVIQRAASFVDGPVFETENLAEKAVTKPFFGLTPPTLNGVAIGKDAARARRAIDAPTLGRRPNADGTAVETWINTVPTNVVSFIMILPSNPPWSVRALKSDFRNVCWYAEVPEPAICFSKGYTKFTLKGKPTDAAFAAKVRAHEDLHVRDNRMGFNQVIEPWDMNLQAAKANGTVYRGKNATESEAELYRAMGGTPHQIASAQANMWSTLCDATHAAGTNTADGGKPKFSNPRARFSCEISSIDVT